MQNLQYLEYLNDLDNDSTVHGETTVGINFKNELVITYHYFNDEYHKYDKKTIAIVDEYDTMTLAKHLKVDLPQLTEKLRIKLGSTRFYCDPDQAEYIFSEVLDFIIDHGLRFKLVD